MLAFWTTLFIAVHCTITPANSQTASSASLFAKRAVVDLDARSHLVRNMLQLLLSLSAHVLFLDLAFVAPLRLHVAAAIIAKFVIAVALASYKSILQYTSNPQTSLLTSSTCSILNKG